MREVNEDSFLVDETLRLYVVCDGMGGHAAGEVASRMAASTVQEIVAPFEREEDPELLAEVLRAGVEEANRRVHRIGSESSDQAGMGTTCTALLVRGNSGVVAHVGDSRLYLERGGKLHQVTQDHTFVAEAIRAGIVSRDDPALAEHSNLVTRAVGPMPEVFVDTMSFDLLPADTMLLCSDGLYEYFVEEAELATRLGAEDVDGVARALVETANERGGHDNITALVLRVSDPQPSKATGLVTATFEALSHIGLFGELTLPESTKVKRRLESIEFEEGEEIFHQGDVSESLYIVLEGRVRVCRDGEEINQLAAGSHFGEMALLNQRPRSATVEAMEDTTLLHLSRSGFYSLVQEDHVVGVKFLWKLAQTLSLRLEEAFETPEEVETTRKTLSFGLYPSPFNE